MAYGKLFESLYTGSMVGAGTDIFTVWTYCIAHAKPPGTIELNPIIMATIFGCTVQEVDGAIAKLCEPDPRSRSKDCEGRKLVKEGEYLYVMPTWGKYNQLRNEIERRGQNRSAQKAWRERQKASVSESKPADADVSKVSRVSESASTSASSSVSSGGRERERGSRTVARPEDVSEQTWGDWLKHRKSKRATVTETVLHRLRKDATAAGMTMEDAMAHWACSGQTGFYPPKDGTTSKAPSNYIRDRVNFQHDPNEPVVQDL